MQDIDTLINACAYLSQGTNEEGPLKEEIKKEEEKKEEVKKEEDTKEQPAEPMEIGKVEAEPNVEMQTKKRKTEIDIEELLATKEVSTDYTIDFLAKLVPMQKQIKYQITVIGTALEELQGNLSFINDYKIKVHAISVNSLVSRI